MEVVRQSIKGRARYACGKDREFPVASGTAGHATRPGPTSGPKAFPRASAASDELKTKVAKKYGKFFNLTAS